MTRSLTLGVILRPLFLLLLFGTASVIGAAIRRRLPEGRLKRVLTLPAPILPGNETEQRDWLPFFAWLVAAIVIWGGVALLMHANE